MSISINSHKLFFIIYKKYTFIKSTCIYKSLSAVVFIQHGGYKNKASPISDHISIKSMVTAFGNCVNVQVNPSGLCHLI